MTDATVVQTSNSSYARLRPVPLPAVRLHDRFWLPRQQINRQTTLPGQYQHCEDTGRIDNFRRASGRKPGDFKGWFFNDSDVYKWLEGMAWALAHEPDKDLAAMMDRVIDEIAAAQQPDGYLNTYFMFDNAPARWTNTDLHELYCAGHLFQAAVAHYRVTGSRKLRDVAVRFANHICDTFGPEAEGKRATSDGHPEIEMALVELFRATGNERYLRQAQFFIDVRGYGHVAPVSFGRYDARYAQDHLPFRQLDRMYGHAVRALYLNCGAADVYLETGEAALRESLERQWLNMVERQMYVSGELGSRWEGEAFGDDYELPNRAYAETCAAIASVMWNWRMLMLDGDPRYSDVIEQTLYNGLISGLSLDGQSYFYQNPLIDPDGKHRRSPWFEVSCCPTNLARFLPSLNHYCYSTSDEGIWVHLYAASEADIPLSDGRSVQIRQETDYPWKGEATFRIDGEGEFALHLRVPQWCGTGAKLTVGEQVYQEPLIAGQYITVRRQWQPGDTVVLNLPIQVRQVSSDDRVIENQGRVAVFRGPILYCFEQVDNPGVQLETIELASSREPGESYRPDLLGGIMQLHFDGAVAVPYYAWANRDAGAMQVWIKA